MTTNKQDRKEMPMFRGLLQYFPDALAYVAHVSWKGNEQHNPGQPLHWAREKSTDHGDCIIRHQSEAGTFDDDGLLHDGKVAWRALAQLQLELEKRGMAGRMEPPIMLPVRDPGQAAKELAAMIANDKDTLPRKMCGCD